MREQSIHIKLLILSLLIVTSCNASKVVSDSSGTNKTENLATINDVYDGDIELEELREATRFKIIPGLTVDRVLSYTILSFDNGDNELRIYSDSITKEAKVFILSHNKLGDKFYITDIIVKYHDSHIDTLNSISLRIVNKLKERQTIDTNAISVRASIDSRVMSQTDSIVKLTLNLTTYKVIRFSCTLPDFDNFWREYSCSGDNIPSDIVDKIQSCDSGKTIIFGDIFIADKYKNETRIPIINMKIDQ